jgi:hypothetical protein
MKGETMNQTAGEHAAEIPLVEEQDGVFILITGQKKFQHAITREIQKIIFPMMAQNRQELREAVANHLFGREGPIDLGRRSSFSSRDLAVERVYRATNEVAAVMEHLLDYEVYIRRFPFKGTRVTKARYLTTMVANYYGELYILKERIKALIKLIEEIYARGESKRTIEKITKPLFHYNSSVFEKAKNTRSTHIHKRRHTDDDLSRIEGLEVMTDGDTEGVFTQYSDIVYRKSRKKYLEQIRDANVAIERVLDKIYDALYPIVFNRHGEFNFVEAGS